MTFLSCIVASPCNSLESGNNCTTVEVVANFFHANTITKNDVIQTFLHYSDRLTLMISNGLVHATYIGFVPIKSTTRFTLSGNNMHILKRDSIELFEAAVVIFLNNMFELSYVTIQNVQVDEQMIQSKRHRALQSNEQELSKSTKLRLKGNRSLSSGNEMSSLDISATVVGRNLPPPTIELGPVIDEVFRESGQYFVEGINANTVFEQVNKIQTKYIPKLSIPLLDTIEAAKPSTNIFYVKEVAIPLYILICFTLIFSIIVMVRDMYNNQTIVRVLASTEELDDSKQMQISRGLSRTASMSSLGFKSLVSSSAGLDASTGASLCARSINLKSEQRMYTTGPQNTLNYNNDDESISSFY